MSRESKGALAGVKIVDLSQWVAGPFATQILGDHGATVIKIEPPGGEVVRKMGSRNAYGYCVYDFSVNRNKRAISLNLGTAEGREVIMRLLEDADVLVSNFRPGVLEKMGLGYDDVLMARFPRLIHASVSAFGADGPLGGLAGMDPVGQAMSGIMARQGAPDGPPERLALSLSDCTAAMYLTMGILMAIIEREKSGRGQAIDTTLVDATLTLNHPYAADWFMTGKNPPRVGNRHLTVAPVNVYKCADGYISLGTANDAQFRTLCTVLGKPEMADDPRFVDAFARAQNVDLIDVEIETLCASVSKHEIAEKLLRVGIPAGPVLDMDEALTHPQVVHRKLIFEDPDIGFRNVGTPIRLSRTPGRLFQRPPKIAEHNRVVLAEAGYSPAEIDMLIGTGALYEPQPAATEL